MLFVFNCCNFNVWWAAVLVRLPLEKSSSHLIGTDRKIKMLKKKRKENAGEYVNVWLVAENGSWGWFAMTCSSVTTVSLSETLMHLASGVAFVLRRPGSPDLHVPDVFQKQTAAPVNPSISKKLFPLLTHVSTVPGNYQNLQDYRGPSTPGCCTKDRCEEIYFWQHISRYFVF